MKPGAAAGDSRPSGQSAGCREGTRRPSSYDRGAACLNADPASPQTRSFPPRVRPGHGLRSLPLLSGAPYPLTTQAALTACSKLRQNGSEAIVCQQLSRFQNFTR